MSICPASGWMEVAWWVETRGIRKNQDLSAGPVFESLLHFFSVRPWASDFTISRPRFPHLSCGHNDPLLQKDYGVGSFLNILTMAHGTLFANQLTSSNITRFLVRSAPVTLASAPPHMGMGPTHLCSPFSRHSSPLSCFTFYV